MDNFYVTPNHITLTLLILIIQLVFLSYTIYVVSVCCRSIAGVGAFSSGLLLVIWSYRFPNTEIIPIYAFATYAKQFVFLTFILGFCSSFLLYYAQELKANQSLCSIIIFSVTVILAAGLINVHLTSLVAIVAAAGKSIGLTVAYSVNPHHKQWKFP